MVLTNVRWLKVLSFYEHNLYIDLFDNTVLIKNLTLKH